MPTPPTEPKLLPRDGTSQQARALAALDPGYVRVDERTIQDLVRFARELGKELPYFDLADRPAGDWSGFIGALDPDVVADLLEHPERFDPASSPELFRPHFVLFLAFLELFRRAQAQMNTLTQRHLDFYYRRVLRMGMRGPIPDRVHLLFDLARGEREVLVPAGSLLGAGPDSIGREQVYRTERAIIVNRIKIAKKSAVFVEQRRLGLREVAKGTRAEACMAMFKLVLGDDLPGYPLGAPGGGVAVTYAFLESLYRAMPAQSAAIKELEAYFFMPAASFDTAMKEITGKDVAQWDRVFAILEDAHRRKSREGRIDQLRALHDPPSGATVTALMGYVLGEDAGEEEGRVDRLEPLLTEEDFQKLKRLQAPGSPTEWERLYALLEVAQRNRLGERPPEKVERVKVFPVEDAAVDGARAAPGGQEGSPRWATFGLARPGGDNVESAPSLGWAISSPLLCLGEGTRVITLTLEIRARGVDSVSLGTLLDPPANPCPLMFQVSTAEGWVECSDVKVAVDPPATLSDRLNLRFTLTFKPDVGPIASLGPKLAGIDGPGPVLRLMLRQNAACYRELASLQLLAVKLAVAVTGLRPQRLRNDEGMLDPRKPFEPFGGAPSVGSRLLIGHPEIVTKELRSLTLRFEWMGAPPDLRAHYQNYSLGNTTLDVDRLTSKVSMIDGRMEKSLASKLPLFGSPTSGPTSISTSISSSAGIGATSVDTSAEDPSTWARYLQWELDGADFGHAMYPAVASSKALDLAVAVARGGVTSASEYKVNPPYTPKLKSLTLEYISSQEIDLTMGPPGAQAARVLHVHPFGHCDIHRGVGEEVRSRGVPFLPPYDDEGELYLGLEGVSAPQSVCLLFQLAEGSANPDLPRPRVQWSYLDGDRWIPCAHRVLQDSTGGLLSSGIVELALDPVAPSTRLRGGLYWIRAALARGTAAVCDVIDIHPQAVSAVFIDQDNAPDHYRGPLPAGTLRKLSTRIRGIAGVRQPYTSRGGRPAEDPGTWATRVSERLRHRQRALTMWDHERLILDRFPQIYKARCLPAGKAAPGRVEIVVIPDIRDLKPSDPFEPRAPSSLLAEIEAYLRDRTPAFAEVRVRNARYVPVRARLAVRFASDGNDEFYKRRLNDDINRFLSPWAFEEGEDITLGGRIHANSLVDFVERRDYVDYVAGVKLFSWDAGGQGWKLDRESGGAYVDVADPGGVLAAARSHVIDVLHDAVYEEERTTGIGFMMVGLDLIVA